MVRVGRVVVLLDGAWWRTMKKRQEKKSWRFVGDRRWVRRWLGNHRGELANSNAWSRHRRVRFERDERRREADGLPSVRAWLRSYHGNDDLPPEVI